jgi:hypothetical protein
MTSRDQLGDERVAGPSRLTRGPREPLGHETLVPPTRTGQDPARVPRDVGAVRHDESLQHRTVVRCGQRQLEMVLAVAPARTRGLHTPRHRLDLDPPRLETGLPQPGDDPGVANPARQGQHRLDRGPAPARTMVVTFRPRSDAHASSRALSRSVLHEPLVHTAAILADGMSGAIWVSSERPEGCRPTSGSPRARPQLGRRGGLHHSCAYTSARPGPVTRARLASRRTTPSASSGGPPA